ncbi:MAG: hybrid sensor histidine kinase/response regulator [bacterium]
MPDITNCKLLIVDDEEMNLRLYERFLRDLPCEIIKAISGIEALEKVSESAVDLVLLDVTMPVMDGFETCRRLKEEERNRPIIMVTALNDTDSRRRGIESGADDFLSKPIDPIELNLKIKNFLRMKKLYDNVKKLNDELERKVEERTMELKEANERLEILDRLKSDFLTFISHELQTPLTSMSVAIELLNRTDFQNSHERLIAVAQNSYRRLFDFVTRGIDYINEQSKTAFDLTAVSDLSVILENVADATPALHKTDVDFRISRSGAPCLVRGDAGSLSKVIRILLDNALKFSRVEKTILAEISANESTVTLTVSDKGDGFPVELADEIFRPFTIANITHHAKGSGLSLPIAKLIVENCRGKIRAESKGLGQGASFFVEFPAVRR